LATPASRGYRWWRRHRKWSSSRVPSEQGASRYCSVPDTVAEHGTTRIEDDLGDHVKRMLVTGGSGLFGQALVPFAIRDGWDTISTFHRSPQHVPGANSVLLDLGNEIQTAEVVRTVRPDIIVHAAALRSVDYCERHPDEAMAVNAAGTEYVARAARDVDARLVFISTDSVFDGERGGYREDDAPRPVCVYGETKLAAEAAIRRTLPSDRYLIVRTSAIYGTSPKTPSLVEFIIGELMAGRRLEMIADSYFSPILNSNLAQAVLELIQIGTAGILHVAGSERCSRHQLAATVAEVFDLEGSLIDSVLIDDVGGKFAAQRLRDSSLDVSLAQALLSTRLWGVDEGLRGFKAARTRSVATANLGGES
ncbi:MAG: SDR family oxidoreductase, partial [Chloroflexi bacterium]|nr:SDR family oxidoreductase [Chloroflexota bacterium]